MAVSEFTRNICRRLCVEKAVDMEINRLSDKAEMLKRQGSLSPSQASRDQARREEAQRMVKNIENSS